MKLTRKAFAATNPKELNKMRVNDPIQFDVLFQEWRREQSDKRISPKGPGRPKQPVSAFRDFYKESTRTLEKMAAAADAHLHRLRVAEVEDDIILAAAKLRNKLSTFL